MWALRRLEIRLLQCALCFYLSAQICDAAQQRRDDLTTTNTGNMRLKIIKIKCLCWRCVPRKYRNVAAERRLLTLTVLLTSREFVQRVFNLL